MRGTKLWRGNRSFGMSMISQRTWKDLGKTMRMRLRCPQAPRGVHSPRRIGCEELPQFSLFLSCLENQSLDFSLSLLKKSVGTLVNGMGTF